MSDLEKKAGRKTLIASLALNIFFVGAIVGGSIIGNVFHHSSDGVRHAPPIHSFANPRRILHEARPAEKHAMIKLMREDMKKIHPLLQDVGVRRREALEAMSAEVFDSAAATQAFEDLVAAETKAHQTSNATLVRMLASLSDEERRRIVENLKTGRPDRRGGQRPNRHHGPEGTDHKPDPED